MLPADPSVPRNRGWVSCQGSPGLPVPAAEGWCSYLGAVVSLRGINAGAKVLGQTVNRRNAD